ncbi:hypothetical protein WDZ11_22315 (plasmid) [Roseomonas mucosa]|uniref:hypothetical protein n=1 Tax=Roseomonas mucosa TaxID=207340 RepID=UPI0030CA82F2
MSQASTKIAPAAAASKGTASETAAKGANSKTTKKAQPIRREANRTVITLETAGRLAPTADVMNKVYTMFGIEPVDTDTIAANTEASLMAQAEDLRSSLSDKAMAMHFQRVVGAYVGSAYGAAQFYEGKRATARELTSKMNEDRDNDRDGPSGFQSRVERAQNFAAEMATQAFALLAAAEGAVRAYTEITGDVWKPYVSASQAGQSVSQQAVNARASAFD